MPLGEALAIWILSSGSQVGKRGEGLRDPESDLLLACIAKRRGRILRASEMARE
jgi:hypothetical protein